jgi:hypothetical protein
MYLRKSDPMLQPATGMSTRPADAISFFNFHPPDGARLFTSPGRSVKRWDATVLVFDVRIGDGILRNYHFAEHWFEVHCTFDQAGRLRPEAGPVNWAFNCDMCTPPLVRGNDLYNVDLTLDILVEPDGVTFSLVDEDTFAEAQARGWLTPVEIAGARRGADELTAIIEGDGLRPFLERILPFDSVIDSQPQEPPRYLPLQDIPLFRFDERMRLWPHLGTQHWPARKTR